MDESGPLINLIDVSFGYDQSRLILDGLNFTFNYGDRLGLVGPNGSGKTTLGHIIMGLLPPRSGTIEIMGRPRRTEADFRPVRAAIGFLFQEADDQLFCPTVAEDVAFGPLNLGMTHAEARRLVTETLNLLGLTGFENRLTYKLSGGEKKLVSLATVLAMRPEMLLLDEPTAGLDQETTTRLENILLESGLPYLIISHDLDFLENVTSKLCYLKNGRLSLTE